MSEYEISVIPYSNGTLFLSMAILNNFEFYELYNVKNKERHMMHKAIKLIGN